MIWSRKYELEEFVPYEKNTLLEALGIKLTDLGEDYLEGTMPVDERTKQPFGILHGGANVALAETLGSIAAGLVIDMDKFMAVGLDINANHLRPVSKGKVVGVAKAIFIGKKTHVWEIKISDGGTGKLTCISRLTMAIMPK
ncbi:MAG: 1,4-dihydroxy-2-naphthoyl-CoA hydrolase [Saprospiraceae bacterium]|jgi:1,4-dihydroxy-2-naphthoyl-CoA hydrolase